MKIAIPLDENRQDVCIVLARAPYFLFREDGMDTVLENPAAQAQSGAGIQAAQFLVDQRADVDVYKRQEQTASGPENAGNQPDGGGDDAGGPDNNRSSETANVSSREELEAALKDSSVSTINIDSNIDMGDTDWNGVQIEKGRTLVINGNDNTISGLKVHKAYICLLYTSRCV